MTDRDIIKAINIAQAHHTSWAINDQGDFVFVLEDEKDEAFAAATYAWGDWLEVFRQLLDVHDQQEAKKP